MSVSGIDMRFLVVSLMITITTTALGQENLIKACFTEWYPYSYLENEQPAGLSIEIYNSIIKRAGLEISYINRPWARCENDFNSGSIDALVDGDIDVPNTLNVKKRPIPWVILFWVHKESSYRQFSGYSQFDNQGIGYVRGYGYPKEFLEYKGFNRKKDVNNDIQGLKMLNGKRYEAFLGDIVNNTRLVKKHRLKVRPIRPAVQVRFLTLSFSKRLIVQHNKFEKALNQMYKDGSIDVIYKKYLGVTYEELLFKYGNK